MTPKNSRILKLVWLVIASLLMALQLPIMARLARWGSPPKRVAPYYGVIAVPGTDGASGSDFSQVYFGAAAVRHGASAYGPDVHPYCRHPAYPPLIIRLYVPLTALRFPHALLVHNLAQFGVFLGALVWALVAFGCRVAIIGPTVVLTMLAVFLSPIGIAHFERGQFEFYCAGSIALGTASVFGRSRRLVLPSALLASLKWSCLPFLGVFSALAGVLGGAPLLVLVLVAVVPLTLAGHSPDEIRGYLDGVRSWETRGPKGISFAQFIPADALPWWSAKLVLPAIAATIVVMFLLRSRNRRTWQLDWNAMSFPVAFALALLGLGYGQVAYEYRAVQLLGVLPLGVAWMSDSPPLQRRRRYLAVGAAVFVVLVALHLYPLTMACFRGRPVALFYLIAAGCFLLLAAATPRQGLDKQAPLDKVAATNMDAPAYGAGGS